MAIKKCTNGKVRLIYNINRYRFKEQEADALTNFLLPMLIYEPEKRATAQQMLENPWLNMEPNFEYKMSDREYEKMNMVKKIKVEKKVRSTEANVEDSDIEQNIADDEDNNDDIMEDDDDDDSFIGATESIQIQNFNNSFANYGQFVNLSALDKKNPQFGK